MRQYYRHRQGNRTVTARYFVSKGKKAHGRSVWYGHHDDPTGRVEWKFDLESRSFLSLEAFTEKQRVKEKKQRDQAVVRREAERSQWSGGFVRTACV